MNSIEDRLNYLDCSAQHARDEIGSCCDFESNRIDNALEWAHWLSHVISIDEDSRSSLKIEMPCESVRDVCLKKVLPLKALQSWSVLALVLVLVLVLLVLVLAQFALVAE